MDPVNHSSSIFLKYPRYITNKTLVLIAMYLGVVCNWIYVEIIGKETLGSSSIFKKQDNIHPIQDNYKTKQRNKQKINKNKTASVVQTSILKQWKTKTCTSKFVPPKSQSGQKASFCHT